LHQFPQSFPLAFPLSKLLLFCLSKTYNNHAANLFATGIEALGYTRKQDGLVRYKLLVARSVQLLKVTPD